MEHSPNRIVSNNPALDRFARRLMATTCLTMAAGVTAQATTLVESTDFPDSPPGAVLPVGTDEVEGNVGGCTFANESCTFDSSDWFEFQGLQAGSPFTVTLSDRGNFLRAFGAIFDSNGGFLGETAVFESGSSSFMGIVPSGGALRVLVGGIEEGGGDYAVTLDAASVPEPGTFIPVGLGLVGALAWRSQHKQQQQKPS